MGVPHHEYRHCKLAYRQGGMKRTMPVYPGASELTHGLFNAGAEVWICTTRPYLRLDNIDPDTREWLSRNGIRYDAVLFDDQFGTQEALDSKYAELTRQVDFRRIVSVVDDLAPQLGMASQCGIRGLYLRDQPYNREGVKTEGFRRVTNLFELADCMLDDVYRYTHERQGK
jgi:hypothetical protein